MLSIQATPQSMFQPLAHICSVSEWVDRIEPQDREHFSLNLLQAYESNLLISAYRIKFKPDSVYWVIDFGEVNDNTQGNLCGVLLAAQSIDNVAQIVRRWIEN